MYTKRHMYNLKEKIGENCQQRYDHIWKMHPQRLSRKYLHSRPRQTKKKMERSTALKKKVQNYSNIVIDRLSRYVYGGEEESEDDLLTKDLVGDHGWEEKEQKTLSWVLAKSERL